jgi:hypothetical protein
MGKRTGSSARATQATLDALTTTTAAITALQNQNRRLRKNVSVLAMRLNVADKLIAGLSRQPTPPPTPPRPEQEAEMTSPPPTRPGSPEPPETSDYGRREEEEERLAGPGDGIPPPPRIFEQEEDWAERQDAQIRKAEMWMGSSPPPEFVAGPAEPVQVRGRGMEKTVHEAPTDPEPSRERAGIPPEDRYEDTPDIQNLAEEWKAMEKELGERVALLARLTEEVDAMPPQTETVGVTGNPSRVRKRRTRKKKLADPEVRLD